MRGEHMLPVPIVPDVARPPPHVSSWPNQCAWTLCGGTLLYFGLVVLFPNPRSLSGLLVRLLYPLITFGAAGLTLYSAWMHRTTRWRWTWTLSGLGVLLCTAAGIVQIRARFHGLPAITAWTDMLYLTNYLLALMAMAIAIPRRTWWDGSTLRLFLDSASMAVAVLVMLEHILPLVMLSWTPLVGSQLPWLALDSGVLFALSVLVLRYGHGGGPLLPLASLSVLCALLGDAVFTVILSREDKEALAALPGVLYLLHWTLSAFAAYRSVTHLPQPPTPTFRVMPTGEWLVWTMIPRLSAFVAFVVVLYLPSSHPTIFLTILVVVYLAREALAAFEQRRTSTTIHTAEAQARQARQDLQAFLDRVIHDLSGPLHGIQTALHRLQGDMQSVAIAHMQTQQLNRLHEQLRDYQRARQVRHVPPLLKLLNPVGVSAAALDAIQDHADAHGIQVRLDAADSPLFVHADSVALRRVLDNLLANALTATTDGGAITVTIRPVDVETVTIAVSDTGHGIAREHLAQIFAPLVRFHEGGTGLGLTIAVELIQAMQGTLTVQSEVGRGSTFTIHLPRATGERRGLS
jgi:signal transduction histidine kinase